MTTKDKDIICAEQIILRACANGTASPEDAFDELYKLYAPLMRGWLMVGVRRTEVDDLFQDVWMIFYRRWHEWRFLPEMDHPEARPVASFLYRTFCFVLEGYRRRALRMPEPLNEIEVSDTLFGEKKMVQQTELGLCLNLARRICPPEEIDVLLGKLAGIPGREIAKTHSITEAQVDHRFRNAIARLQKRMKITNTLGEEKKHA